MASHLLKWVHYRQDVDGRELELRYFRDVDGREVDFVLLEDGKPQSFIECKIGDAPRRARSATCSSVSRVARPGRSR